MTTGRPFTETKPLNKYITTAVSDDDLQILKAVAKQRGQTQAFLIRNALRIFLEGLTSSST